MRNHLPKNYTDYSVNDFVLDQFFYDWVVKSNPDAVTFWEQWVKDHPAKRKDVEQARSIIRSLSFTEYSLSGTDISDLWNKIKRNNARQTSPLDESPHRVWLKIAATLLIFASAVLYTFHYTQNEFTIYNTAFGETKVVVLPDSSTVKLNSNSTLRFPSDWDDRPVREVWIEGEGFFSVTHKKNNQPFKVHTDDGVAVEVLGTTFNVFHRVEETKVVLNTGKIRLSLEDSEKQIEMKPGDLVEYKKKSYSTRKVNAANYTAWTKNRIVLDHTSLREMTTLLKNNFGIDTQVSSETLLNQTVSGSMPIVDGTEMVNQVALAFQLKIEKRDNRYLIYE